MDGHTPKPARFGLDGPTPRPTRIGLRWTHPQANKDCVRMGPHPSPHGVDWIWRADPEAHKDSAPMSRYSPQAHKDPPPPDPGRPKTLPKTLDLCRDMSVRTLPGPRRGQGGPRTKFKIVVSTARHGFGWTGPPPANDPRGSSKTMVRLQVVAQSIQQPHGSKGFGAPPDDAMPDTDPDAPHLLCL